MKPLCIELFFGMGGWSAGWLELGGRVIGFDLEHLPHHGPVPEGAELVIQDVLTLSGRQFKGASLLLASPPCQAYSYRAMPWKRAKALPPPSNELFDACFRIQREACEAAGRHIPMIVENVKGAQPWVGRADCHFGSFYLWFGPGDMPALMPKVKRSEKKTDCPPVPMGKLFRETGQRVSHCTTGHLEGSKNSGGSWFAVAHNTDSGHSRNPVTDIPPDCHNCGAIPMPQTESKGSAWECPKCGAIFARLRGLREAVKVPGLAPGCWPPGGLAQGHIDGTKHHASGAAWYDGAPDKMLGHFGPAKFGSHSNARKAASAQIAKIPLALSRWIAQCYFPHPSLTPPAQPEED